MSLQLLVNEFNMQSANTLLAFENFLHGCGALATYTLHFLAGSFFSQ